MSKITPAQAEASLKSSLLLIREYAETLYQMMFIVNSLAAGLILFNLVEASKQAKFIVAAIAIAYGAVAFVQISNNGVKYQTSSKKTKR